MSERSVRILVFVLLTLPVGAAWDTAHRLEERFGQSYPGFFVIGTRIVAPPASRAASETLARSGLASLDQIVSVDGRAADRSEEIWAAAHRAGPGVPLRYGVRSPAGTRFEVTIATRPFTREEAPATGLMFGIGVLWLLVGAGPVLARPSLRAARLFFVFSWAMSCNFAFLAVDHLVLHRFLPWSFAVSTAAIATLIHLGMTFPEERWPFRAASGKRLALLYSPALFGFAGFAALHAFWRDAAYLPTLLGLGLYGLGVLLLLGNMGLSLLRPAEVVFRQRARVAFALPVLVAALASLAAGLSGWQLPEIGAAAFFAGVSALPVAIAWATFQHNLFDLDAVVRRGLAAGGAALVVSLGLLAAFAWLRTLFGVETAWATAALSLALVLAAVPLSQPLRRRLQRGVDSILFPGRARAAAVVTEATRALARVRDRASVARLVTRAAREATGADRASLVSGSSDGPLSELGAAPDGVKLDATDPLTTAVRRGQTVHAEPEGGGGRAVRRRLAQSGLSLLLPLPTANGVAALLLGPRADGRRYGRDDLYNLQSLAAQAALALRSAEAWDELAALGARLERANVQLRRQIARHRGFEEIVGDAPGIAAAREQVAQVAGTSATVLVLGETGTGKELIVQALHRLSDRAERPLVRVACAAIPETLLESELFGHEKGAFTDATSRRIGRFEVADGGTLFLDDVDTLPLSVQAKLLRALQEGEVQRLGSNEVRTVDVRTVAATNRDLREEVRAGRFREDLYYRLYVVPIRLPALRERGDDIPLLVQHFVELESAKLGREVHPISEAALDALCAYAWPGNVRELRNVIERAIVMSRGDVIELAAELGARSARRRAPDATKPTLDDRPLAERVREFKAERIRSALARTDHNLTRAAELLGLHRQSLSRMVRDLGLRSS